MANYKTIERNSQIYVVVLLVLLGLVFSKPLISQNIRARFLKESINQEAGSLIFNVAKVYNKDNKKIKIKPVLLVPEGWAVFNSAIAEKVIEANDSIALSFRIKIPQNATSDNSHKIVFQLFSNENKLILQKAFRVQTIPFHDWDVIVPNERLYFFPGNDRITFEMKILNNGNTIDTIRLDIKPGNKIQLTTFNDLDLPSAIIIKPGTDTIIKMLAKYSFQEDRIFDLSKIQIHASTNIIMIYRAVILEKYSDNYTPFEIDHNLPHQVEFGFRTFNNNQEVLPFIKTSGIATFSNEDSFKYNFTYYDLTQTENVIGNSYYNFLYTHKELNIGLGAFSSMMGRNLY
ncbi:MAG: hypothetical protein DRJ07_09915, partial [Bacteroidetes bacterium]